MTTYIGNGFSPSMLNPNTVSIVRFSPYSLQQVKAQLELGFFSVVGHMELCAKLTDLLGITILYSRATIRLRTDVDTLIIASVSRERVTDYSDMPFCEVSFMACWVEDERPWYE